MPMLSLIARQTATCCPGGAGAVMGQPVIGPSPDED